MKVKTKAKLKYKSKAAQRAKSSYEGAIKLLNLLERAEHTENVSSVVASQASLDILEQKFGNF